MLSGFRQWKWLSVIALVATLAQLGTPVLASTSAPQVPIPNAPIKQATIIKTAIPTISSYPTVTGTSRVPQVLKVSNGKWAQTPTNYQYAWYRCDSKISQTKTPPANCEQISNASNSSLALSAADVGKYVSASVTAQNSSGSLSAWSASSAVVIAQFLPPVNTVSPSISGNKVVSQRLTVSNGTWKESPSEFSYSWFRCLTSKVAATTFGTGCSQIDDSGESSYTLTQSDIGKYIVAKVTGSNAASSNSKWSSSTTKITPLPKPTITSSPAISGTATFTRQLSVDQGKWSNYPTSFSYQWFKCSKQVKSVTASMPSGCSPITGATGSTYFLTEGDIRSYIAASVSVANATGTSSTWTKSTTAIATLPVPDVGTAPRLVGDAQITRVLSVNSGIWNYLPTSYTYQWYACKKQVKTASASLTKGCSLIPGAASSTYQLETAFKSMYVLVKVTAFNRVGSKAYFTASTSAISTPSSYAPISLGPPQLEISGNSGDAITGQAMVGSVLVAEQGTWLGFPIPAKNYSFWYRCIEKIESSTDIQPVGCYVIEGSQGRNLHVVTLEDLGYFLVHEVIATNTAGVTRKYTPSTEVVTAKPVAYVQPHLTGGTELGSQLSLQRGSWASPPSVELVYGYSWYRCESEAPVLLTNVLIGCTQIEDADGLGHTIVSQDVGKYVFAVVTASNRYDENSSALAGSLGLIQSAPKFTTSITAIGNRILGEELALGDWQSVSYPMASQSIQWLRCTTPITQLTETVPSTCTQIEGVSEATYTITQNDLGKFISVAVTLTNSLGAATKLSLASQAIGSVPVFVSAPTVSGDNFLGVSLSASYGVTGTPAPAITYQWLRCSSEVLSVVDEFLNSCSTIAGASSSSYAPVSADLGKFISARVTATNSFAVLSAITLSTQAIESLPGSIVPPTVSGVRVLDEQLTVSAGTWSGYPAPTFSYQWVRCTAAIGANVFALPETCLVIPGENEATYTSVHQDVGKFVTARVTATNIRGSISNFGAVPGVVASSPTTQESPVITGTAATGTTLRSSQIAWDSIPAATTGFQWYKCDSQLLQPASLVPLVCAAIAGATSSSFVVTSSEAGKYLSVASTATNIAGAARVISASSEIVSSLPSVIVSPTITGNRWIGSTLTVVDGQWAEYPTSSVTYQWYRCSSTVIASASVPSQCSETIAGANSSTYSLDGLDAGLYVTAVIEHTNPLGTARAIAAQSQATYLPPEIDTQPSISGLPTINATITLNNGIWTGFPSPTLNSTWLLCDNFIGSPRSEVPEDCIFVPNNPVISMSAGGNHSCAVLDSGSVNCWGLNSSRQLGDGTTISRSAAVLVSGVSNAVSVSAGGSHSCAVLSGGSVKCWGLNSSRQLGDGTNTARTVPVLVSGVSNAVSVSAGGSHSCAVLSDGSVKCWGSNVSGLLGDGTNTARTVPVLVSGVSNAVSISAGTYHTCALLSGKSLKCWGSNDQGQLGDGTVTTSKLSPVSVLGISNATSVSVGLNHSCAVLDGGSVKCWGSSTYGQLGDGTYLGWSSSPVTVFGISNASSVSAGSSFTCAVLQTQTLECWGWNRNMQLGGGTIAETTRSPISVPAVENVVSVSTGSGHSCSVLQDGSVLCWGSNSSSQLGNEQSTNEPVTAIITRPTVPLIIPASFVGKYVSNRVLATNAGGSKMFVGPTTSIVTAAPTPTVLPSLAGVKLVGESLTLSPGTFVEYPPADVNQFKWYRCQGPVLQGTGSRPNCTLIDNETGSTYTQTPEDAGYYVSAAVLRANAVGATTSWSTSNATTNQAPVNLINGFIDGEPRAGSILSASEGLWQGFPTLSLQIQWYRCTNPVQQVASTVPATCATIAAGAASSYQVAPADMGYYVTFSVTRGNNLGTITKVVQSTSIISGVPVLQTAPNVSGVRVSGATLTASNGVWLAYPSASISRQWYRCGSSVAVGDSVPPNCSAISGETGATYSQSLADAGKYLTIATTSSNSVGSRFVISAATSTSNYPPTLVSEPTISGAAVLGSTLTSSYGEWLGFPVPSVSYQWYRCAVVIAQETSSMPLGCEAISTDGQSATYVITGRDMGHFLVNRVTLANDVSSSTRFSRSTVEVVGVPNAQLVPEIAGVRAYGQTLSITDGTWWANPEVTGTQYQWYRCSEAVIASGSVVPPSCAEILGQQSSEYLLTAEDSGFFLTATVTKQNDLGSARVLAIQSVATVQAPLNMVSPNVSNVTSIGEFVTASNGTWQGFPLPTYSYKWLECAQAVSASSTVIPSGCSEYRSDAQLSSGSSHTCIAHSDGNLYCWGVMGALFSSSSPLIKSGTDKVVQVASGLNFTCYMIVDSSVKCFGLNSSGQLGDGSTTSSAQPVAVAGLEGARNITAGEAHACAQMTDGTVKCWGKNASGQLGIGSTANSLAAQVVPNLQDVVSLDAGANHTCAVLAAGSVKCWGQGASGQIGDSQNLSRTSPVAVSSISTATQVSAGGTHTCALLSTGGVRCWGANASGQLGNASSTATNSPVGPLGLASGVSQISSGASHTCAVMSDGTGKCWGLNSSGQLGTGNATNSTVPATVSSLSGAVRVSAGTSHTCVVLSSGSVSCWGLNTSGQIGNGTTVSPLTTLTTTTFNLAKILSNEPEFGKHILVGVTARNSSGTATHYSASSGPIQSRPFLLSSPTLTAGVSAGNTIIATTGTWSSSSPISAYSFEWFRCETNVSSVTNILAPGCVRIPGESASNYLLSGNDAGKFLLASVTAISQHGTSIVYTRSNGPITAPPVNLSGSSIAAAVNFGQVINAGGSTWQGYPNPTLRYEWFTCDSASGASCVQISDTGSAHTVTESELGRHLKYAVIATNSHGFAIFSSTSQQVAQAAPTLMTSPTVSGGRVRGNTLAVSAGSFVSYPDPTTSYQWYQCSTLISVSQAEVPMSCQAISGANASTYIQNASDAGSYVTVATTKTNALGTRIVVSPVTTLTSVPSTVTSVSSASNTARVGQPVLFSVFISDSLGNPLRGVSVEVHWRVSSLNTGKKSIGFVTTDSEGRAQISYTFTGASSAQVFGTVQATSAFPTSSNSAWSMTITN